MAKEGELITYLSPARSLETLFARKIFLILFQEVKFYDMKGRRRVCCLTMSIAKRRE